MKKYAVILAAGVGSRLLPITGEMPKSLVRVQGREIIDYQIKGYLQAGLQEENILVVAGYMADKIEAFLKQNYPRVRLVNSPNFRTTNNMYSLYLALSKLKNDTNFAIDLLFVNNADCLYQENLIKGFACSEYENAVAVQKGVYLEESMKIVQTKKGNIIDISKQIAPQRADGVSVDLYKFGPLAIRALFEIIRDFIEIKKDLKQWTEVAFPLLFQRVPVFPYDISDQKWVEVDNLNDLLQADKLFSDFRAEKIRAWICDLDGTLVVGQTPIVKALDFVRQNQNHADFYFLTNNTSQTPVDYVRKLENIGLCVSENQIATPLYPLVDYIRQKKYQSVYLIANQKVRAFLSEKLKNVCFDYDYSQNQAVILTYDTQITYEKMKNAATLLHCSAVDYIATHRDVFCPHEKGPIPDIGSFIALLKAVTNRDPQIFFGKPCVHFIEKFIKLYGAENVAVVGDRLYTDKKMADLSLCPFVCVLSGETTRLDVAKDLGKYPAIVLQNLGEMP